MSDRNPEVWLRFLGGHNHNEARPRLCLKIDDCETELELKPRDRIFLAALAVPRAMSSIAVGEGRELPVLASHEISDRTSSDRSIIGRALGDLEDVFAAHDLRLQDYITANRGASQYGLRAVHVDIVELLAARDAPDDVDRLLCEVTDRPANVGLTEANRPLFNPTSLNELAGILQAADARWKRAGLGRQGMEALPGTARPSEHGGEQRPPPRRDVPSQRVRRRRPPPRWVLAVCGVATLIAAVAVSAAITGGNANNGQTGAEAAPSAPGRFEITGGAARVWSNYANAGGTPGQSLTEHARIYITCRVRGFEVEGGNVWWYRLGQSPWSDRFYASADGFYNNGDSRGSLRGTPKVDPRIPLCP